MLEANHPAPREQANAEKSAQLSEIADHFSRILKRTVDARTKPILEATLKEKPTGINWRDAYTEMAHHIVEYAFKAGWPEDVREYITPEDIAHSADLFVNDLNNIDAKELLFEDMKDPRVLARLLAVCSNLKVWTMGDIANKNQRRKVESSGIEQKLQVAKEELRSKNPSHQVEIEIEIKDKKTDLIPEYLDNFWKERGEPDQIAIIIIDDSRSTYKNSEREIANWEARHSRHVKVNRIYIRSKRGKKASAKWEPIAHPKMFEGESAQQFADIAAKELKSTYIDPANAMMLLDFDGTIADNKKLDELQLQHVHRHLDLLLENAINEWLEDGGRGYFAEYSEHEPIYEIEKNRRYVRVLLDRVIPLMRVETPFCKQTPIFQKLEAEIGYQIEDDEIEVLQELDEAYRRTGELLTYKAYRNMIGQVEATGRVADKMSEIGNWDQRFHGIGRFVDEKFFSNPARIGDKIPGIQKALYNLTSEYARTKSQQLAIDLEKEIDAVCRDEKDKPKFRFVSGGIKSRKRMEEKLLEMGIEQANEILDLVRGKIVVEDIAQLAECTADLTRAFGDRIVKFNNYYQEAYRPDGEPPRAFKATRIVIKLSEEFTYELQVQTRRSKAAGDFDHETTMKGNVVLTKEDDEYTRSIFWFANILDYEEFLDADSDSMETSPVQGNCGNVAHQSDYVRNLLYKCWLSSGANFNNPEVLQEFIEQFSSKWDEIKPDHIDQNEWDKNKEKIIYLIKDAEEEMEVSTMDVGETYQMKYGGIKYLPPRNFKSIYYKKPRGSESLPENRKAYYQRREAILKREREDAIKVHFDRFIQKMEQLVLRNKGN